MANQFRGEGPRVSRTETKKREKEKRNGKNVILRVIGLFFVLTLFVSGAYVLRLLSQTQNALNNTYSPLSSKDVSKKISEKKPFSILLVGADTGGLGRTDRGNSDTLILTTVNPKKNKVKMISIPRDTLAEIEVPQSYQNSETSQLDGYALQKINSAYSMGGLPLSMKTVEKNLNVPIDYYMMVNFSSLQKIVDGIGGIDVDVPFTFTSPATGGQHFEKGKAHLNGEYALAYSRMRHEDPQGDYGRQKRQRQVIQAIVKKLLSANTLTKYQKILNSVSGSMKTDLTFDDMTTLAQSYRSAGKHMDSDFIQGNSTSVIYEKYPSGLSVEVPSNEELQRVSDEARTSLGMKKETLKTEVMRQNKLNEQNGFVFGSGVDQVYKLYSKDYDTQVSVPYI
ncbi:LCP family protein [Companilactobacillus sp. DQM5]|uniref:LCP family protein n=1 Tax=Companilactobacillus sp. DQM5 TaxID=3463359 RepID=UPI004058E582